MKNPIPMWITSLTDTFQSIPKWLMLLLLR